MTPPRPTLVDRARVILTAAVTYLVLAAVIVAILIDELGAVAGIPPVVVKVLGGILTACTVAITIIRRVTPVLPAARSITPVDAVATAREAELRNDLAAVLRRRNKAELDSIAARNPGIDIDEVRRTRAAGVEDYPGEFA